MPSAVNLWPLLGVAVVIVGFLLRAHPVLVVIAACVATGVSVLMSPVELLAALGAAFVKTRNLPMILLLPLAAIGLLERFGLREHAQAAIARVKSATAGRLLIVYLAIREVSAALGLTSIGGHPTMVRPLIAPMAEGAAERQVALLPEEDEARPIAPSAEATSRIPAPPADANRQPAHLPDAARMRVKAMAAATDNVGLFFGEDIFVAFGAIVLMQTILHGEGIAVEPLHMALWGIPTAVSAFIIHAWRLHRLDVYLAGVRP